MRVVKSFSDVNIALRELFDFKDKLTAKSVDWSGRQLKNVGAGTDPTDAVIVSQLGVITQSASTPTKVQPYTIMFSKDSALIDLNTSPAFIIGLGKEGIPTQVWINAQTPPSGGPLTCNPTFNGVPILANPIEFDPDSTAPVFSSTFIDPVPVFGSQGLVLPGIITANNAALFSMGIVVRLIQRNS